MKAYLFFASIFFFSAGWTYADELSWETAEPAPFVLYGSDDRVEIVKSKIGGAQDLGRSTLALMDNGLLKRTDAGFEIVAPTAGHFFELCRSEKFREQPAAAFCSGVLVAPDLVLTAAHCLPDTGACMETSFVFDYWQKGKGQTNLVARESVYRCQKLLNPVSSFAGEYAIVELDRPVPSRTPVKIRPSGPAQIGTEVFLLGHPLGTPLKVAGSARILKSSARQFFVDADSYVGNSGSPIFNRVSGELEGLLTSGQDDFSWRGSCRVSRICKDRACTGEQAVDASLIAAVLQKLR